MLICLPFRVLWQFYPNIWTCSALWLSVFAALYLFPPSKHPFVHLLMVAGCASNALVTIANGGQMPVITTEIISPGGVWRNVLPGDRFLWLCDRFAASSIGDLLVVSGIVFLLVTLLEPKISAWFAKKEPAL